MGFYEGRIAEAIVQCVQQHGGVMAREDLKSHESTFDTPIKTSYRGMDVWEMPPNGQGITALLALNILEGFDFKGMYVLLPFMIQCNYQFSLICCREGYTVHVCSAKIREYINGRDILS